MPSRLCAFLLLLAGCGPTSFLITPMPTPRGLKEYEVLRESIWTGRKIALVDVEGVLSSGREWNLLGLPAENPVARFKAKLDKAADDHNVHAVVLRINSPGGGVTASDLMYTEVRRFKDKSGKPVVAALLDVAASGGYYLACAADRIYAQPTTVTGSIGVIMIAPDISGTLAKIGATANVIKSGELKDAGSPFRHMNDRDRAMFQRMIDAMYERFVQVVAKGRSDISQERLRGIADGRVFLAPEAKQLGLIDEIGTLQDAIEAAKRAAGIDGKPVVVVQYARPPAHRANIYAQAWGAGSQPAASLAPQVNLINLQLPDWHRDPAPQFLYVWAPQW